MERRVAGEGVDAPRLQADGLDALGRVGDDLGPGLERRDADALDVGVQQRYLVDDLRGRLAGRIGRVGAQHVVDGVGKVRVRVDGSGRPAAGSKGRALVRVRADEDGDLDKVAAGHLVGREVGDEVVVERGRPRTDPGDVDGRVDLVERRGPEAVDGLRGAYGRGARRVSDQVVESLLLGIGAVETTTVAGKNASEARLANGSTEEAIITTCNNQHERDLCLYNEI